MFGVRRRNPLADKTRFSGLSLHHGFLPLGGCQRLQFGQLECLQDQACVRAASADPAPLWSIVHAKRHQGRKGPSTFPWRKGAIHISLVPESGWPHPILGTGEWVAPSNPWYRRVGGPIQSLVPESGWPHPISNLPLLS